MTDNDFKEIIKKIDAIGIGREKEKNILGLIDLLKVIGISPIPTEKILDAMEILNCEKSTRIQVLAEVVQLQAEGRQKPPWQPHSKPI